MDRRTFNRRMLVGGGVAAATGVTSMSLGAVQAGVVARRPQGKKSHRRLT